MTAPALPRLCLVTDRRRLGARTNEAALLALEAQCEEGLAAGIELLLLRETDLDARPYVTLATRLVARSAGVSATIIVNDRADVARASGAGLHLKSDGPPATRLRAFMGAVATIGRSAHDAGEIAGQHDVDYWLFGTVFPSGSKPVGWTASGEEALAAAVRAARAPVLAIGGVTAAHAGACQVAGAAGVAGIEIFLPRGTSAGALGPAAAARALREAWSQ